MTAILSTGRLVNQLGDWLIITTISSTAKPVALADVSVPVQLHSWDWSMIVFPVRLQGGASSNKGQLEVFHDGQWGSICDDGWDDDDATVACRSLGFGYGEAFEDTTFGESEGPIWLDDVDCSGYEQNLAECRLLDWGVHDCYGWERASVRCFW